ncbi:MAG: DUF922 domain-containing protein [Terrimonas sp.]|nr:DUF922 domain-containing protein [Terrimonas sp.]
MLLRRYLLIVPFLLGSFGLKKKDAGFIDWQADRKLEWIDFEGNPEKGSDRAALSSVQININFSLKNDQPEWHITCRFNKKKSWGKTKTDYILSHEQAHFDITEIFARKLHQRMLAYQLNKRNFQQDLQEIYQKTMKEENEMQRAYDQETEHSIIREKQADWLEKIKKLLADSENFTNYR